MSEPTTRQGRDRFARGRRRIGGWAAWGGGVGAALVSALLVALPAAVASTPVTHLPPFKGATAAPSDYWGGSGCASTSFGKLPSWSAKSGAGAVSTVVKAKTCSPGSGSTYSYGYTSSYTTILIPTKVGGGKHSVQPSATFAWNASESYNVLGKCPAPKLVNKNGSSYCSAEAEFEVYAYGYLIDLTNNTYTSSATYFPVVFNYSYQYNDTSCYYTSGCSSYNYSYGKPVTGAVSKSFTWYFNLTANKTHAYDVEIYVSTYTYASVALYPRSSATAYINMGTLGNGYKVTQVVVA